MHERSLMRSLLRQVEQLRIEHDALTIDAITVETGPLSGVEPELVRLAFDELAMDYFISVPTLHIDSIPLRICCRECGAESDVPGMSLQCPSCTSVQVHIIRGDAFRLIDVSLQIPMLPQEHSP